MKGLLKQYFHSRHSFIILPITLFTLLFIPFITTLPYMDGNIDFVQSYDFYTGGLSRYFLNWGSVHPPFKLWLTNISYTAFGMHPAAYNLLGLLFGIIGILSIYGIARNLFTVSAARISAFLLTTSGMFFACSLFSMRDFILTSLLLAAVYFYTTKRYLWYGITASALVLTKETGLLLPMSILVVEFFYCLLSLRGFAYYKATWLPSGNARQSRRNVRRNPSIKSLQTSTGLLHLFDNLFAVTMLFSPIITFACWLLFLQANHQKPWSDWLFATTADKGTFYTIFYNLISFNFLNQYAYQQWLHLFILNFNWVYWSISIVGIMWAVVSNLHMYHAAKHNAARMKTIEEHTKTKTIFVIVLFFIAYFLTALTIQTYTIPRYILPLVPFLLLTTAWSITTIAKRNHYIAGAVGGIVCIVTIASLFFSIDPVSQKLWGTTQVFDQTLYGLNNSLSGNDGITYNMQYVFIAAERSKYYYGSSDFPKPQYFQSSCDWMMKDPNNDIKMMHILELSDSPFMTACTQNVK